MTTRAELRPCQTFTANDRLAGATVGDFLDSPIDKGGLAFSRPLATVVLAV